MDELGRVCVVFCLCARVWSLSVAVTDIESDSGEC